MENNLPNSWELVKLVEELNFLPTGVTEFKGTKKYYSTGSIQDNEYTPEGEFTFNNRPSRANRIAEIGDVLQARMKATDKGILVDEKLDGQLFSTGFLQIRPFGNTYHNKLLYYLIKSDLFLSQKNDLATGSTQEALTDNGASEIEIPIPPLAEQHRIVTKLDAVMQKVESNKQRLDKIPKLLRRFRQSVLATAVNGKLTEDWRTLNTNIENASLLLDKIEISRSSSNPKLSKSYLEEYSYNIETPESWIQCRLGQIHDELTDYHANGSYVILKKNVELLDKPDYAMMIRATNFEKNNFASLMLYINEHGYNFLKKSKLFGGEVIIGKIGNAGKVYYMPQLNSPCSLAMNLFALKFNSEFIKSKYIYYYLTSIYGEVDIKNYIKGVGNITIDKISIRSLLINLPPYEEQIEIVRRVEQLFAFADKFEARYMKAKAMLDKLPQSILAQAFRGELVAQDPNDEPASVLLERIKKEKERLAAEKKGKKTKTYSIEEKPLKIAAEEKVKYKKAKM
ncbi:MAG: restriction endonuclease subunit S [Bacteroidetes bacterium]|nr:restriction endonuclease subunit S [Bacteroidota bacterium]